MVAKGYEWPPAGAGDLTAFNTVWEPDDPLLAPFALREEEEVEEKALSEDITVEPLPYLHQESCAWRSSSAFSHREGYADFITQGTVLQRSPGVNSDTLTDCTIPSNEELAPSIKESPSYRKKMLFLGKKRHQHWGKVFSRDMQPTSEMSSSFTMEGQFSFTRNGVPPRTGNLDLSTRNCQRSRQGHSLLRICHQPGRGHLHPKKARCHFLRASHCLWASYL